MRELASRDGSKKTILGSSGVRFVMHMYLCKSIVLFSHAFASALIFSLDTRNRIETKTKTRAYLRGCRGVARRIFWSFRCGHNFHVLTRALIVFGKRLKNAPKPSSLFFSVKFFYCGSLQCHFKSLEFYGTQIHINYIFFTKYHNFTFFFLTFF